MDYDTILRGFHIKGKPYACWEYKGKRDNLGYGHVYKRVHLGELLWHRYMYKKKYGLLSTDILNHLCDNPPCGRPTHLLAGTQADNVRYGFAGHHGNHCRKVSKTLAKEIYTRTKHGEPRKALVASLGLHYNTVKQYSYPSQDGRGRHNHHRGKLSEKDKRSIVKLHCRNVPIKDIADTFGIHGNNVRQLLIRLRRYEFL